MVIKFSLVKNFIPKINNWAVCDLFCADLKILKKKMWNIKYYKLTGSTKVDERIEMVDNFNKNDEISLNGIYYIVTPSLTQNCYKIIEIDEDNGYQIFTSLVKMEE